MPRRPANRHATPGRIDGFSAVFALDRDHAWFVGDNGRLYVWNGSDVVPAPVDPSVDLRDYQSWDAAQQLTFRAVWASGPSDAWAVGEAATVLHFDGTMWRAAPAAFPGTDDSYRAVTGTGPDDVWIGGDRGTLWHFDGTTWSSDVSADGIDLITGIVVDHDRVLVAATFRMFGMRSADGTWTKVPETGLLANTTLAGSSLDDVWAVGDCGEGGGCGAFAHFDGTSWRTEQEGPTHVVTGIWNGNGGRPWATCEDGWLLHRER